MHPAQPVMLDVKKVRDDLAGCARRLARRGENPAVLENLLALDDRRRRALTAVEEKKARKNAVSKEIGALKKSGGNADDLLAEMKAIGAGIDALDADVRAIETESEEILLRVPNLPDDSLPDTAPLVVKTVGATPQIQETHVEIGTRLGLVDFERGVKIATSRFYVLKGLGARLERALIAYMLDSAILRGYTEVMPPLLVNEESMKGTGQFPKFADDYFTCKADPLSLIPTAEVPVTNLHRDEILEALPVRYCAYTPCFRREAGSYGQETRGLVRVHQFNKIEIVKFVAAETSMDELESLALDAEAVLEGLELPYRRVLLPANDVGFSAAKTYDLEIWMPGLGRYLETSSCSNFTDFQARRMRIRHKRDKSAKPELVHTLNGSAVAVGRTFAAILENHLQSDGSVRIPAALRPYCGNLERIAAGS